jgi:hypothetical protein
MLPPVTSRGFPIEFSGTQWADVPNAISPYVVNPLAARLAFTASVIAVEGSPVSGQDANTMLAGFSSASKTNRP